MKKDLFAIICILALIIGAVVNIMYLTDFTDDMTVHIEASQRYCEADDYDSAEKELRTALRLWLNADGYTHVFIRHSEVDSAADAFYDVLSDITQHDKDSAVGNYEKLLYHITSILSMEKITIKSIF